jgi:hypothetical protein
MDYIFVDDVFMKLVEKLDLKDSNNNNLKIFEEK